jgi:polysaccharide pyruvyl transferase WcaK-like protein
MFHKDFQGYSSVHGKPNILKSMTTSRNIIMGGGGHWGMDANLNVLILCIALYVMRFILRKKVYLLGVGYYSSTNRIGHLAAWLAGKAANVLIARDDETYKNFGAINSRTIRGEDLAFSLPTIDQSHYQNDIEKISESIQILKPTILISFRRFRGNKDLHYRRTIENYIRNNPSQNYLLTLFEPRTLFPEYYDYLESLVSKYPHISISIMDYTYNPVAFYFFYRSVAKKIQLIAPQYHGQLVAYIAESDFFPLAYDNKVSQLHLDLKLSRDSVPLTDLTTGSLENYKWVENGRII